MSEQEATYKTAEVEVVNAGALIKSGLVDAFLTRTFFELAQMEGELGMEAYNKAEAIFQKAFRGSIARTYPRDWTLYGGAENGYGYLQDSGCERFMALWKIDIYNVSQYTVLPQDDGSTLYMVTGDGFSRATGQRVERVIGARDTKTMEMGRGEKISPAVLTVQTMKAARSNLDGSIVRHLCGMGSVPHEVLTALMGLKSGDLSKFNKGKGFLSQEERHGGAAPGKKGSFGTPPKCPTCGKVMRLFDKGEKGAWWGCPAYETCGQKTIPAKLQTQEPDKQEPEPEREPGDEDMGEGPPSILPNGKTVQADPENARIGEIKNRMTEDLKGIPGKDVMELKRKILVAKTREELFQLEMLVTEMKQAHAKGGKL